VSLAGALALDIAGKKTNEDLVNAIKSYLDTHQHLWNNSQFAGLFPGGCRGQWRNDKNTQSSSDQHHMTFLPSHMAQTGSGPGPSTMASRNWLFGAPILSYSNSTVSYSYPQNQLPYHQFNPNPLPPPIVYNYPYYQPPSQPHP
jgi:hypothetical protein